MVLRSRYTEDCLAEAAQRRVLQYLILGAGLDTFAYRQPPWGRSLRIFEVDHPLTQDSKKERLAAAAISVPANLTFAPIDFQSVSLSDGLRACGFDLAATTFCSWLGVTVYLTEEAIDTTFEFIAHLPHGTEIVFTYIPPLETLSGVDAEVMAIASQSAASVSEPWISFFLPAQLKTRLRRIGFCEVIDLPREEAQEKYFRGRRDGLGAPRSLRLVRAIV
jgi:methyltransferase (TIGR00027 family)